MACAVRSGVSTHARRWLQIADRDQVQPLTRANVWNQPNFDLLNLYSIIMADVEATHPSVAPGDAIIDDGEEAESKVYPILHSELDFPIHVCTGNYAHEAEGGRNGERS